MVERNGILQLCLSYVAEMSSDVMGNTEPIISCVLSENTQHKTGN